MEISPLTLMVIGMITVFLVLTLVVLFGNLLTHLVNKYIPETPAGELSGTPTQPSGTIEAKTLSAIVAAVEWATKGKGKVTGIEKRK